MKKALCVYSTLQNKPVTWLAESKKSRIVVEEEGGEEGGGDRFLSVLLVSIQENSVSWYHYLLPKCEITFNNGIQTGEEETKEMWRWLWHRAIIHIVMILIPSGSFWYLFKLLITSFRKEEQRRAKKNKKNDRTKTGVKGGDRWRNETTTTATEWNEIQIQKREREGGNSTDDQFSRRHCK